MRMNEPKTYLQKKKITWEKIHFQRFICLRLHKKLIASHIVYKEQCFGSRSLRSQSGSRRMIFFIYKKISDVARVPPMKKACRLSLSYWAEKILSIFPTG